MFPTFLNYVLINVIGLFIPVYIALHALVKGDQRKISRSTVYFCIYVLLKEVVFKITDPILGAIHSTLVYEAKIALFLYLIVPRFGAIEKIMAHGDTYFEKAQARACEMANKFYEEGGSYIYALMGNMGQKKH